MSPEAQRIAIAEACPKIAYLDSARRSWWLDRGEYDSSACYVDAPFDPLNDLNAMHEAEKMLTEEALCARFAQEIAVLCKGFPYDPHTGPESYIWHATAAQRAEAFLRTIGKWEDAP